MEKSEGSDTASGSTMKVNVMYRGIVYRVRGIKVLCSVVTAVVLLLVAIVGLGIWMLVSAYAEEKADPFPTDANSTAPKLTQDLDVKGVDGPSSTPYTIDFNAPSVLIDEASLPARVPITSSDDNFQANEAIGHFQGVTPGMDITASSRFPAPAPSFGLFGGVLDLEDEDSEGTLPSVDDVLADSWQPTADDKESDSVVNPSEARPVVVPPPSDDYSEGMPDDAYNPSYPLQGGLPDNIPRDIDPALLEMGLPFPYPPSLPPTGAATPPSTTPTLRRHTTTLYRDTSRRGPPGNLRRQQSTRPSSSRPSYQQRPSFDRPHYYDYDDQAGHGLRQPYNQQHNYDGPQQSDDPYNTAVRDAHSPGQPSPSRETQTESYEGLDKSPATLNQAGLQQYIGRGAEVLAGITLPAGVTIPPGLMIPEGVAMPENLENLRRPMGEGLERIQLGPRGYFEDMMYYYNEHERKRPTERTTPSSVANEKQYSQRKGLTEEDTTGYSGPPVVGYGDRIHTTERRPVDPVFQHFWDVYSYDGKAPAEHEDRGPVPEDISGSSWDRPPTLPRRPRPYSSGPRTSIIGQPNIRGPRPNAGGPRLNLRGPRPNIRGPHSSGQGYPLPVRPDAERPPVQMADRKLLVDPNPRPYTESATRPKPHTPSNHRPLLGPLYDIYEYSRKLASTLLSFPIDADSKYDASKEEYMQNEVELLEDYNKVFHQSDTTSADVLPDMFDDRPGRNERLMLPDSEKLRSLNPFELSLITWTFLDFWEFLIEKVGTLSKEDLQLLEMRLELLRQNKDRVLTHDFMTATVNHVSQDSARSLDEVSQAIAMAQDLETLPEVKGTSGTNTTSPSVVEGRMWDPLGVFSSEQRVKFMQFAMKVLFNFGRVYLKKQYALDCMMLLFCKDLNANAKKEGMDGIAAKIKR
ncbi:uncharacterized protein [Panulirus ornatus]|uniref:uncharacterized protein n=1 Tax=Panulirus ornatus TaxID=150431 RepID=UPI003A899A06